MKPPRLLSWNLLTGAERRQLRELFRAATDRDALIIALSEATPSHDYASIVRTADFDTELNELIRDAERGGWLRQLIDILTGLTRRPDILTTAAELRARVEDRLSQARTVDGAGWRLWGLRPLLLVGGATLTLGGVGAFGLCQFTEVCGGGAPAQTKNFILRLQDGGTAMQETPVHVERVVFEGTDPERREEITNSQGEAFFFLPPDPDAIYVGAAVVNSELCDFPAFRVLEEAREAEFARRSLSCRPGSDAAPEVEARVRNVSASAFEQKRVEMVVPEENFAIETTDPVARLARAPLGLPEAAVVLDRLQYTLGFDPEIRSMRWAAFLLDPSAVQRAPRRERWRADPDLPKAWQLDNSAYINNPYDRGHMVSPRDVSIGRSEEDVRASRQEASFFSVAVPQPDSTNRATWLAVEEKGRDLATALGPLYTVAGPVYPSGTNDAFLVIGPDFALVPIELYRVHLRQDSEGTWRAIGFLVPNDGTLNRNAEDFLVSVAEIEARTGLTFFPELPPEDAAAIKGNQDLAVFSENPDPR